LKKKFDEKKVEILTNLDNAKKNLKAENESIESIVARLANATSNDSVVKSCIELLGKLLALPNSVDKSTQAIKQMSEYLDLIYNKLKDNLNRMKLALNIANKFMDSSKTLEWANEKLPPNVAKIVKDEKLSFSDVVDIFEDKDLIKEQFGDLSKFHTMKITKGINEVITNSNDFVQTLDKHILEGSSMVDPLMSWKGVAKQLQNSSSAPMLTGNNSNIKIEEVQ